MNLTTSDIHLPDSDLSDEELANTHEEVGRLGVGVPYSEHWVAISTTGAECATDDKNLSGDQLKVYWRPKNPQIYSTE